MINHQPVLVDATIDALNIFPTGAYIDGTFGQGGHSSEILKKLGTDGRLVAIDKDPISAIYVMQKFSTDQRFKFYYNSFTQIEELAKKHNLFKESNGILLDLGTSATQLDTPERGFSFLKEGPLDMRMNPAQGKSAASWLAKASVEEMITVFREYGQERWSKRIAEAIAQQRQRQSIQTTRQLAQIVRDAHPRWPSKIHPATRIFQAIRIYINQELKELSECLEKSANVLSQGGRLAVITFHSLEARQVKEFMRKAKSESESSPAMRWIHTSIKPSASEIANNPRARSAVLRVMEKN